MNTVTLCIAALEDVTRRALSALRGEAQGAFISFASSDLLWQTLTCRRWDILKTMTGQGRLAIREVARRIGRDVKATHRDVHALLDAGILERTDDRGVIFPYDAIHVDFTLHRAA